MLPFALPARAASPAEAATPEVETPNFVDQRQRMTRPDLGDRPRIRFLTTTDYPPFNFLDSRGKLTGFNIDLVRDICEELEVLARCQIEARPFNQLIPALEKDDADAIVAGVAMTPENRQRLRFTEPYFRYPARFVTLRHHELSGPLAEKLAGKTVAVLAGSAHSAMLHAFFPKAVRKEFQNRADALGAVKAGDVAAYFGDGVGLSFWLESDAAEKCCAFSGGPFLSDRFLGEGLAIAVKPNDSDLANSIDYAISQVVQKHRFSELLLRYFPISAF